MIGVGEACGHPDFASITSCVDPVGQERGVRGVVNVGFDDGGVDAQAPAPHDAALAPQGHQPGQHILARRASPFRHAQNP